MTMSTPGGRRKPPTIHDVAREAGVSRGTVSRVLNGGHYVSPSAQEAVNAAIRRTGYVVNRHARSLITGRSDSVGFLLTEPQERFFEDPNFNVLLRGCTQALATHDVPLLLMLAATEDERRRITRYITAGHVDGVLLVSSHSGDPIAQELREAGVPLVACGKPIGIGSKVSYVAADDRDGARDMVRHLLSLGRRRVGVVTGPLDTPGGVERLAGYREVLAQADIAYDERLVASGDYSRTSGEAGARALLERAPDLDAVFVASDLMAQGVLSVLRDAGRRVPEDVAVGGFDDSPAAVASSPALTTIRQPWDRISGEMVRVLLAQIGGEDPAAVILPTELVKRDST
ncbi:LacI family DNA-binding transcriptional regulator [Streptomyces acidiscabies]|uniref:LacI family DNA-binding transcriptional regulator n=1 Tax=Streptomyces acidiscabies TaxID=42234 RepID=A0AAP6EGI4_9ACTN|nr:LacI family DNA-binding transcriptional regulator [Streptomyces acidiscabies]MBP5935095.1 LacI family transcriptional regulator [Streptomyces sp. LBUM 1476]MBZ3917115.1 LacI family DNA-binding transcriptional regulator [Streptomyces acidiscabies]MDX2961355.1 LacI family DNA-binding transcriptional regulator [Streptomyces acidiscabies]MDX3022713.1 LacI family DNA-binding transcriptional regulator [Streptomyces acidiscabies]MDX3792077.1 LacI family DNA-binding transcriptional regulator [Strep